jgi:ribosome biogenesis protein SSF1/2
MFAKSWNQTQLYGYGYSLWKDVVLIGKERRANKLKDYLTMAGLLGVTHMLLFSRTETGATLRIARTPRGPTLHFKLHSYSLAKDVKHHQKAPKESVNDFLNPPLVYLSV